MRILQINSADIAGGAEGTSWRLFEAYQERGHDSWLAVGKKRSNHASVLQIPNDEYRSAWARFWYKVFQTIETSHKGQQLPLRVRNVLRYIAEPRRWIERKLGLEDFNYPGSWRLLELLPSPPDVVHLHNLHGGYFDLRVLPWLSKRAPTVFNPRDAWPISGHCAHSLKCERWLTGCGRCPDLKIYPPIKRDATAYNWQRKRHIFTHSRLYVVTPSRWLMRKIERSILATAIVRARVIPNGVDLSVFSPADKKKIRARLGLPIDASIMLFAANGIRQNVWKDYETLRSAFIFVADRLESRNLVFIALGEDGPPEHIGKAEIKFIPFQRDRELVAAYYQAADVYIHAAKADTFPNSVIESLACGTPVVATMVGGIPEQVKGLEMADLTGYELRDATGILVPQGDVNSMAEAIIKLLTNETLRYRLGENAVKDSRQRFDFQQQVDRFLEFYKECIEHWTVKVKKE